MMKLQNIKQTITLTAGRGGLLVKKYSPEILITVGVVGVITSTVMACKATTKAETILNDAKENIEKIEQVKNNDAVVTYTDKDYKKDIIIVKTQTATSLIKAYGPALTLGVVSIGCILGAHNIMRKRNLALVAAYKAVEESFMKYRKRVIEEYGSETDTMFKNGIKRKVTKDVDENGKETGTFSESITMDPNGISQYAKYFDESCSQWTNTPEYNLTFLKCQQNYANDQLKSRGHIFLNEVYDMLGIPRTQAGAVVGWVKGEGDDFVDFGMFDASVSQYRSDHDNETIGEKRRDFVNGYLNSILLDFNVSGVIYDMI